MDHCTKFNIGNMSSCAPVITLVNNTPEILIGTNQGYVKTFSLGANSAILAADSNAKGMSISQISANSNYYVCGGVLPGCKIRYTAIFCK